MNVDCMGLVFTPQWAAFLTGTLVLSGTLLAVRWLIREARHRPVPARTSVPARRPRRRLPTGVRVDRGIDLPTAMPASAPPTPLVRRRPHDLGAEPD